MTTNEKALLNQEDFHTSKDLPAWLYREYKTFHQTVTGKTFPCFFGIRGQLKGEPSFFLEMPLLIKKEKPVI